MSCGTVPSPKIPSAQSIMVAYLPPREAMTGKTTPPFLWESCSKVDTLQLILILSIYEKVLSNLYT